MKLYLDEHVSPLLAHVLRERGIDCVTTQEAGNIGKRDHDQLTYAPTEGGHFLLLTEKIFFPWQIPGLEAASPTRTSSFPNSHPSPSCSV